MTPVQLLNAHKVYCESKDKLWQEELQTMIAYYKKLANKYMGKSLRKLCVEIVEGLERELKDGYKDNPDSRGTVGFRIGKHKQADGSARDTDKLTTEAIPRPVRVKTQRVYCTRGQTL